MRILIVVVLLLVVLTVVFARLGHDRRGNKWGSGQGKHISRSRDGRRSRDSRDGRDGRDWRDSRLRHPRHPRRRNPPRSRPSNPPGSRPSNPPRPRYPYNPNHWINSQYSRPRNSYEKFPKRFKFGANTNAYEVEGEYAVPGIGYHVYDNATNQYPQLIVDRSNGDVASDSYNLWRRDVEITKELKLDFYSLEISWVRILPHPSTNITHDPSVKYYNDLLDALIRIGVEPVCTLTRFQEPEILARYGGYTNPCVIDAFVNYADTAFRLFGDRCKAWITFDIPNVYCNQYHGNGNIDPVVRVDPGITEYLCYKNILIAHAKAYRVYKKKYSRYGGKVGMGLYTRGFFKNPDNGTDEDVENAWAWDTIIGYPIFSKTKHCGDWDPIIVAAIEELSTAESRFTTRLPPLTHKEQKLICGASDFLALVHFTSQEVRYTDNPGPYAADGRFYTPDARLEYTANSSWPSSGIVGFYDVPEGLAYSLGQIKEKFGNCDVLIKGNGFYDDENLKHDTDRIRYMEGHLKVVLEAIQNGSNVCAYAAKSMIDGFEDLLGYTARTGLYSVDFASPQKTRERRDSADWYCELIDNHVIPPVPA